MTKNRIALFGSAMALLLCGAGAAGAQGYYDGPGYDRTYDDRAGSASETIIVHPNDEIVQQQLLGRHDGEMNSQAFTISRPVNFSDLNLSRGADVAELHARIYETASNLCAELDARVPGLS